MSAAADPLLPVYPRLDVELVAAQGCWLTLADGRQLLDLYGGHAVSPLGHAHPELVDTIKSMADRFTHQSSWYSNPWAIEFAELLATPVTLFLVPIGLRVQDDVGRVVRRIRRRPSSMAEQPEPVPAQRGA